MRKIIIGLSGIVLVALVIVLFTNARNNTPEGKKNATEMSKDCSKCPSASACNKKAEAAATTEVKTCDPAKCKELGCDPAKCKEGKCDPAKCKAACPNAKGEGKKCEAAMSKCCPKK